VFKRMCAVDKTVLLKYMINVCSQKCGLPMSTDGYEIVFDNVFFLIQHPIKSAIIFIYGPNGMHFPEFHLYRPEWKRVKIVPYRFWEDQGLSRLFTVDVMPKVFINKAAQTIGRDPFSCIAKYLGMRDLLNCRIVCRQWHHNLAGDAVWNARLPVPVPDYTGLAAIVRCAALIQDFRVGWMSDSMQMFLLSNINAAWMHRYRDAIQIDNERPPGVLFVIVPEGDELPKKRRVRLIASAKQLIVGISKVNNSVRTNKAGCLHMYGDEHSAGATCWISPKTGVLYIGKLKGAKPYDVKIHRLHEMMFNWMDSLFFKN